MHHALCSLDLKLLSRFSYKNKKYTRMSTNVKLHMEGLLLSQFWNSTLKKTKVGSESNTIKNNMISDQQGIKYD